MPPTPEQVRTPDLPETVVMNFAKLCNLWCRHCFYPDVTRAREERARAGAPTPTLLLPFSTLQVVVDEMAGWPVRSVLRIASDGEPLINPEAVDMVAYAKSKGVTVCLTTNGILITEEVTGRLLECGIDVVDISIDAARAESYVKVRGSRTGRNLYPAVERNVRHLIEARDALGPPTRTRVLVNMIDQPLVHTEVPEFIAKWKAFGADAVLIRPFHSTSNQTVQQGVASAGSGVARFPCKFPFTRTNVGFDEEGHPVVYYCSHDWTEKTVVGVLGRDGGLRDIWHGEAMEEIRRRHRVGEYPPGSFCGPCPDWYLGWGKSHQGLVSELRDGEQS